MAGQFGCSAGPIEGDQHERSVKVRDGSRRCLRQPGADLLRLFVEGHEHGVEVVVVVGDEKLGLLGGWSAPRGLEHDHLHRRDLLPGILVAQAVAKEMIKAEKGGSIVNISSVSGIRGNHDRAAYNASKGAVCNLTRNLAVDFGAKGVRVNAVLPGLVETDMPKHYMTLDGRPWEDVVAAPGLFLEFRNGVRTTRIQRVWVEPAGARRSPN